MKYCADTWFLLELHNKNDKAVRIFREAIEGKNRIVIPTVSIFELIRLGIRAGESLAKIESMLNELKVTQKIQIILLDEAVAKDAAKISVSFDVPSIDSIVAATHRITDCDELLSNDRHLKKLHERKYLKVRSW